MNILYVGNSYTYANNTPRLVQAIAKQSKIDIRHELLAAPGAMLIELAASICSHERRLLCNEWHHVILQEQSTLGRLAADSTHKIQQPSAFYAGVSAFMQLFCASKNAPKLWLVQTWPRRDFPDNKQKLDTAFERAAQMFSLGVIRVSDVWRAVQIRMPSVSMYDDDGSHPRDLGSYVFACCILTTLTGQISVDVTTVVEGTIFDEIDEKTVRESQTTSEILRLSPFIATQLKEITENVILNQ
jgi:hypothetical protein